MKLEPWTYHDCEDGLHEGNCCWECVSQGEKLCCECRNSQKHIKKSEEEE